MDPVVLLRVGVGGGSSRTCDQSSILTEEEEEEEEVDVRKHTSLCFTEGEV